MTHIDWTQVKSEAMTPMISRKALHSASMTVARLEMQKDAVVAEHSHHHEQITLVEKGALKFAINGGETIVRAGESLVIPSHMPHGVVVLEPSVVIDIFSPSREDWPR